MSRPLNLRKRCLLPDKAVKIARIVQDNQPISRGGLEKHVEKTEALEQEDIRQNVRLLRMSDNLEIEDGKAKIKTHRCKGTGNSIMEKFKHWKREAQKN